MGRFAGSRNKDVTSGFFVDVEVCFPLNTSFFEELTWCCKAYDFNLMNNGGLFDQKLRVLCTK